MCVKKSKRVVLSVAATHRSLAWFRRLFLLTINKNVLWEFAIDGLPKDSHKYRINQDGQKLFEIMKEQLREQGYMSEVFTFVDSAHLI